jgi:hypothetical protein
MSFVALKEGEGIFAHYFIGPGAPFRTSTVLPSVTSLKTAAKEHAILPVVGFGDPVFGQNRAAREAVTHSGGKVRTRA